MEWEGVICLRKNIKVGGQVSICLLLMGEDGFVKFSIICSRKGFISLFAVGHQLLDNSIRGNQGHGVKIST